MAEDKKGAARWRQPIVFVDESGFLLQPIVRRTWSPLGQTPILIESALHDRLSAIGAISISPVRHRTDFFFQLHRQSINAVILIPFLCDLHHHFRKRVVLIWDNLRAHYKAAKYFAIKRSSWFRFEYLPPYCPELNPVEDCWSHVKYGCQSNFAARDLDHLRSTTHDSMRGLCRNHQRLSACLEHAKIQI